MKLKEKTWLHLVICTLILFAAMISFIFVNYIDFSVTKIIYLPIYAVVLATILFGQYIVAYFLTSSAVLGLIIEYIIHLNQVHPSMEGTFWNTLIVILWLVVGIILQIIISRGIRKYEDLPS